MIPQADRYPEAEIVEWGYSETNRTYYKGTNQPAAIIIHVMQGWANTAKEWAREGHYGASWHFTVARDGKVCQHLGFADGGYHAGISATKPAPSWKLWRGYAVNVNNYTVGIEHEGFTGEVFPAAQIEASAKLSRWLCDRLGFPADRDHIVGHYEIDRVDRANDPGPTFPWTAYLAQINATNEEEPDVTDEQIRTIVREEMTRREDDAAKRLNAVLQIRMAITSIANEPDVPKLEQAAAALRGAGFKV